MDHWIQWWKWTQNVCLMLQRKVIMLWLSVSVFTYASICQWVAKPCQVLVVPGHGVASGNLGTHTTHVRWHFATCLPVTQIQSSDLWQRMEQSSQDSANPRLVLLFSGKRKSGKDFITDRLQVIIFNNQEPWTNDNWRILKHEYWSSFYQESIGSDSVILRLSGPLKECYAKDHGLDFDKMLSASDYKEK